MWLHPFLERNKVFALALTQAPRCPVPDRQQLSCEKTNPFKDIGYFITVAVFSTFNSCGWTQGTAHNIKWTLHSTGMKFPLIHVYRALQAIVSFGTHFSITHIFFKLSSLAKSEFWESLPFCPETKWMHWQKIFWHLAMDIEVAILKIIPSVQFNCQCLSECLLPQEGADFYL